MSFPVFIGRQCRVAKYCGCCATGRS
jgi:hypothetical protein